MFLVIGPRPRAMAARATGVLVLALAVPVLAAPAAAAPARPVEPAGGGVVDTLRPTFRWTGGGPDHQTAGYEVHVDGIGVVARSSGDSATAELDLPDDSELRWFVRRLPLGSVPPEDTPRRAWAEFVVATPPAPPLITEGPVGPTSDPAPVFAWSGARSASRWSLLGAGGAGVARGEERTGGGRVQVGPLAEGEYVFRAEQVSRAGVPGPPAERRFSVDTTPPAPPLILGAPQPGAGGEAVAAWTGVELGARCEWRVIAADGRVVAGPVAAASWSAAVHPLPIGSYIFQVRQLDVAGNASDWASAAFAIAARGEPSAAPPPPGPSAGPPRLRLPTERARALRPRAGARVAGRRPVLRWARGPGRTRVYNVQIFRVRQDGSLRKVFSGFPPRRTLRVPPRRLSFGACYVWRVWPFLAERRFAARPVGVSHFCVAPRAGRARATGGAGAR